MLLHTCLGSLLYTALGVPERAFVAVLAALPGACVMLSTACRAFAMAFGSAGPLLKKR